MGGVEDENGSNVDNQLAYETFAIPKLYGLRLVAACALKASIFLALKASNRSFMACGLPAGRWL